LLRFFDYGLFEAIRISSHKSFLKDFEEWQIQNQFPQGRQFYVYPEDLADANRILTNELPKICIEKSGTDLVIDFDRFAEDLAQLI